MKAIKFIQACNYNGKYYEPGDELIPTKEEAEAIIRMNEKGFIEPLTIKELEAIADGSFFIKKQKEE